MVLFVQYRHMRVKRLTHNEDLLRDEEIATATSIALAATEQLIASIQYPARSIMDTSLAFLLSAALGVVSASSTAEIIREAGPEGCHIDKIAEKNGMDPMKIGRVLRPLATRHIFREVSPNVFAHNRISALLDTGKSSEEVLAAPEDKHQGAQGFAAIVGLNTDETFKAAAYIEDVVINPSREEPADELNTPLNRAFNTHVDLFSWYERPENRIRFRRFGMAMDASRKVQPPGVQSKGFDWESLPKDALVLDVGGGVGSTSLEIARTNPHLKFMVQDKEAVIHEGKEHWERELPGALEMGLVSFQVHDFFNPQPVKHADVFMLRYIVHDWSDEYALKILKHLRDAAQPTTILLVLERIIPFVCGEDTAYEDIPGAISAHTSPHPLLANMGVMIPYLVDMQMMALLNGCERTLPHFSKLLEEAGWGIQQIYPGAGPLDQLIAKPI
ncbi:O-methyltransferase [Mycena belliarum]|uniref:O-methyltransferase n=1 Tax=Mycena belliarum TaxID=1033014 RepID=A0AAD6TNJ6_9AGAR|nr:O-methyltransferase [Mycena belliae]